MYSKKEQMILLDVYMYITRCVHVYYSMCTCTCVVYNMHAHMYMCTCSHAYYTHVRV